MARALLRRELRICFSNWEFEPPVWIVQLETGASRREIESDDKLDG